MPVANIVGQADNLLIDGQHPFWNGFQASGTPVGRISSSVQRASNILPLVIAGLAEGCCARTKNAARMAASRRSMRSCPEVTIVLSAGILHRISGEETASHPSGQTRRSQSLKSRAPKCPVVARGRSADRSALRPLSEGERTSRGHDKTG